MNWLSKRNAAGAVTGRVRVEHIVAIESLFVSLPTAEWYVKARGVDGTDYRLSASLPSEAAAIAFIDDLILNGS